MWRLRSLWHRKLWNSTENLRRASLEVKRIHKSKTIILFSLFFCRSPSLLISPSFRPVQQSTFIRRMLRIVFWENGKQTSDCSDVITVCLTLFIFSYMRFFCFLFSSSASLFACCFFSSFSFWDYRRLYNSLTAFRGILDTTGQKAWITCTLFSMKICMAWVS